MWVFSQASAAARAALLYITIGSLTVVWCVVWWVYLKNNPPRDGAVWYLLTGCGLTGLTLLAIGLGMGAIGKSAKRADQSVAIAEPQTVVAAPAAPAVAAAVPAAPAPAVAAQPTFTAPLAAMAPGQ